MAAKLSRRIVATEAPWSLLSTQLLLLSYGGSDSHSHRICSCDPRSRRLQIYFGIHQMDEEPADLSPVDMHIIALRGSVSGAVAGSMFGGACASLAHSAAAIYYVSMATNVSHKYVVPSLGVHS